MIIGVNAAGVRIDPPIFDMQGSISVLDPSNNSYAITCMMHTFGHHNIDCVVGAIIEQISSTL